jgi:transcriptional regulator with XRE-family HTH domain
MGSRRVVQTPGSTQLRGWLRRSGRSSASLAREVGVTAPAIFHWCAGNARPKHEHRLALERVTGVRAVDWFTDAERDTAFQSSAA